MVGLTAYGRERLRECCGNCFWWTAGAPFGECWSTERQSPDAPLLPADHTSIYDLCEAWLSIGGELA